MKRQPTHEDLTRVTQPPTLPPRPAQGHKGLFGRVLVVGGSDGMIGAPVLAATAALRLGAGLVQLAVSRAILPFALSITPELVGLGLGKNGGKKALLAAAQVADAIVAGPGLGTSPEAQARLMRLIRLEKPLVLDADALNVLAAGRKWPTRFAAQAVLTPHPGEMKRLGALIGESEVPHDDEGRARVALKAAHAFNQVIVLKGHRTLVTDGRQLYVNGTGDSTLSKAGTGDVLGGMIGCLLAQGLPRFDAASVAVRLHGLAGELAGQKLGRRCALARDILDAIPEAVRRCEA